MQLQGKEYFKNGSSILTQCVKTKDPASDVNLNFGHTVNDLSIYLSILARCANVQLYLQYAQNLSRTDRLHTFC